MALDITYLGHSGFIVSSGKHCLVIDPFLTDNPVAKHRPGDIKCAHILVSHGHFDHFGDTVAIARNNGATLVAAYEVTELASKLGVKKCEAMNPGGRIGLEFGWIALTQAFHSSSYHGQYTGMPCGIVLNIGGVTIYHTGDTALFSDMKLIAEIYKPDIAMICAGDRFTMGPELASRAAEFIGARHAVPIHWGTWPPLAQEPELREKFRPGGVEPHIMKPGEVWKYG
jgi:L-ascorbate metabolism protein UlaG (beta-lactamase superfamily)